MRTETRFDVYGGRPASAAIDVSGRGFDATVWVTDEGGEVWLALVPTSDSDASGIGGHVPCRPVGSKLLPGSGFVAGGALPADTPAAGSSDAVVVASGQGHWIAVSPDDVAVTIQFATNSIQVRPPPRA